MMYDNQRVYPTDTDTNTYNPTKYVMLSENGGSLRPPPYRRAVPRYHSSPKRRCSCVRCLCCCCCILILLILILASLSVFFFHFYKPKLPKYKVQGLKVGSFKVQPDFSLISEFIVDVKAENPNENIGIAYGKDSSVIVAYSGTDLCSGKLPAFLQDRKNTTMMNIVLKGKSEFGSGLQAALMENEHKRRVPLLIMVQVPVRVVLGKLTLRQIVVMVNCTLVVDNLAPNKTIGIISSVYHVSATL